MSTGKENSGVEEVECGWNGYFRITQFPSKAAVGRLRQVLYDVECCKCRKSMALFFLSGP